MADYKSECPERIFLNIDPDDDPALTPNFDGGEVTWCVDAQWDSDVEYIRLDLHRAEVARLRQELKEERVLADRWRDVAVALKFLLTTDDDVPSQIKVDFVDIYAAHRQRREQAAIEAEEE